MPTPSRPAARPAFQPVVVGGDIGAYSLARAFHEAYGLSTVVVSRLQGWHVTGSAFVVNRSSADPFDPDALLPTLEAVAGEHPDVPLLLLGSADATVKAIIALRDRGALDDRWVVPYVPAATFAAGTEKQNFTALCERLDVPHPLSRVVDLSQEVGDDLDVPFDYPVIAKPGEVSEWKKAEFPGKQKVHTVGSRDELLTLLRTIRAAGYRESVIVQDRIPGDDQNMRILTAYCDADSRIRFASWGRTLLEEHTPGAIGNPVAILTGVDEQMVAEAQKLVTALGWTGYANFDLKYDPRDGATKFFELNPRLGRSNYYVTAGGNNPVTWYVDEHLGDGLPEVAPGEPVDVVQDQDEVLYSVVPTRLVRRYTTLPDARARLDRVVRAGKVRNPLVYPGVEKDLRRRVYFVLSQVNYVKKFREFYRPETVG
jgi:D-aspartate ligase